MESVASEISKRIGYMVHYKDNIKNLKARVVELKAMEVQVQCRVEEGERYVYWSDYRMKSWLSVVVDMLEQVRPFLQDDEVQTLNTINLKSRYELGKRATKMEAHVLALLREAASFPSSSSQSHPLIYGYFGDYFGFESESRQSIISKLLDALMDDKIPSSPDTQLQYFHNLRSLAIEFCDDLKHVFPASVARTLAQLKEIRINDCSKMEGFLYGEREIEVVEFPCLTNLELIGVPNLKCFWVDIDIDNAGAGILPNQSSDDDTAMKTSTSYWKGTSSSMEQLSTSEIKTKSSLGYVELHFVVFPSWIRLPNLEEFRLHGCRLLRVAFPSTIASQLVKLRILEIKWCFKMEYIVGGPEEKDRRSSIPVFPELTSFIVDDLPELMAFSSESHMYLERISLDELKVTKCPKIKTLFETLPPDYETSQNKLLVSTNEVLFKIPPQVQRSINVKFLEVGVCDNLSNVFSTHAANLLMGLERMEIRYCEKMREIVGKEEEEEEEEEQEVFHACDLLSLEFVTFDGCFQLKTFSYKNHFNTPNLKQININGSKYEIIEDLNTTIEKVMSTKSLIFDMKELERIEPVLIPDKDAIRDLEIEGCDKLMNAIPCNLIARLRKLEKLAVRWCDSLEEIFEYEDTINFEEESNVTFSCLEEITMFDLENLKHVFTRIPKTIIGFQKLRKLCVHGCRSLRNIFSVSSVRGLLQLQELKISSCNGLQEIVAKENKEEQASRDRIAFPQLRRIEISDTCTLESFYSGVYDLVMPLLESLHLNKCPCIKKFSNGSLTAPKLHKVQGDCMGTSLIRTSPVVDLDEIITKKKKRTQLRIYNREKLQNIGHDQLPYGDLSQIHELEIQACDELLCAIPSNLKPTDLQKLEKLVVRRCRLLEEIFDQQGASFGSGSITTFSNLEEITLLHLEKLQHVFCEIPKETVCFQKLRKLHIHDCYSLLNIFTVSTAKGLQELKELKLSSCDALEEIVAEGEKEEQAIKDEIVFPQLRSIDISYSPKLVFFYSGIYALKLPSLKSVFLYNCPCMLTFSKGLLITPSEVKVQIDNGNYKLLEDGLNDTMKYKDLLLQQDKNSQGSEEHQQDSEFPSGSKAQMYNNTDGSRLSAEYIAALEHENQMMKRQLTFMEHRIANLEH
ncbi:hypothetical protein M5689_001502 [Euphorbia peplus]|nr:hypothetical protein M5689_001502 [Euphorbia peplus]